MGLYKIIRAALLKNKCKPIKLEEFSDFAFCLKKKCDVGKYEVGTYYNGKNRKQYILCRLFSKF